MRHFFRETKTFWMTMSILVMVIPVMALSSCYHKTTAVTVLDVKSVTQELQEHKNSYGYLLSSQILYTVTQQDGHKLLYFVKPGSAGNHLLNNLAANHMYRVEFVPTSGDDRFIDIRNIEKLD